MSDVGRAIEQAIEPIVQEMSRAFKSSARSQFGQRRSRNTINGKKVPRLSSTFRPTVQTDAQGFGIIRFKTVRHAYILHHGHGSKSVVRKKPHQTTYSKGALQKTNWLTPIHDRYVPRIADAAVKVSADVTVRDLLPTPAVL